MCRTLCNQLRVYLFIFSLLTTVTAYMATSWPCLSLKWLLNHTQPDIINWGTHFNQNMETHVATTDHRINITEEEYVYLRFSMECLRVLFVLSILQLDHLGWWSSRCCQRFCRKYMVVENSLVADTFWKLRHPSSTSCSVLLRGRFMLIAAVYGAWWWSSSWESGRSADALAGIAHHYCLHSLLAFTGRFKSHSVTFLRKKYEKDVCSFCNKSWWRNSGKVA